MTREQQQATRDLQAAQEAWLRSYGWIREMGGRWCHPVAADGRAVSLFDAMTLTRAQPLAFGAAARR